MPLKVNTVEADLFSAPPVWKKDIYRV